jgi:hypothetical protein
VAGYATVLAVMAAVSLFWTVFLLAPLFGLLLAAVAP